MALFTHDGAGTGESVWRESALGQLRELSVPSAADTVVVVAAHPDDESLGAGGLIALAAAAGARVRVVIATDGEASHPHSPTHTPHRLATIRRAEVAEAMQALSPMLTLTFLGMPDGGLAGRVDELSERLREHVRDATLVVTPWRGDEHPDHEACAAAATRLRSELSFAHWQYPIWAWHWAQPSELPWPQLARLALTTDALAAKAAAVAAHRSQHSALSDATGDEPIVPSDIRVHFERDCEVYVVGDPAAAGRAGYFDDLYEQAVDPWGLSTRFYERRKREIVLASLPRSRFVRAFEPGCATGELTVRLAQRCAEVVAWDGADAAIRQAAARCDALPNVTFEQRRIPADWPAGRFDLIVLSEVGYYCADLQQLTRRIAVALTDRGVLAACHWRRAAVDHPHTAEQVHDALAADLAGLHRLAHHDEADFVLDVWSRDPRSVAQAEGIVE
jgi:LmbE family N-acetylglucosaminyl deacetylase/SAM-dependent methyltransferase